MIMHLKGSIITATDLLNETYFENAIIFITSHNADGATGFVINRPFHRTLNELQQFKDASAIAIYEGGPVDNEHLYFLHQSPGLISGGEQVAGGIFFGGNFNKTIALLGNGQLSSTQVKIFIGYCGWNNGELEAEIREGSWIRTTLHAAYEVFRTGFK